MVVVATWRQIALFTNVVLLLLVVEVDGFSVQAPISSSSSSSNNNNDGFVRSKTTIPEDVAKRPLSPLTLAGKIERNIMEQFGVEESKRVVESLRWLENDYEHCDYVGTTNDNDNVSSSSSSNSNSWQMANSYVRDLTCTPFWDVSKIDWANKLKDSYPVIREEFQRVVNQKEELQQKGNNIWAGALTEDAGSYGVGWKTLVLLDKGIWDSVNCNLFPKTAQAIQKSGLPTTEVFFASMEPHTSIQMHSDFCNFVLTSHLAIDIPYSGDNKCRLTIGDTTQQWTNGNVMLFDTSILHDAINESDQTRYILMFRVWHPDLTTIEQQALQYIWNCLALPDLLSDNMGQRFMAEQRAATLTTFPTLTTSTVTAGFGGGTKRTNHKKNKKNKQKNNKRKGFGS